MRYVMRWHLATLGVLGMAAHLLAADTQVTPIIARMGTATLKEANHEWLKRYAAALERDTRGRIRVEVYPASQLGSIARMIEQAQFGSIQGWVGPPEFLSGVDMRYEVLSAPGLFKDIAHANRVLQDPQFNTAFLSLGANKGLKGIGLFVDGPASFVSRKPVRKIADFNGLKIRVLSSPLQREQVRALGATPVPMALGQVLTALQQGALDAVMAEAPVFVAFRYYSVGKYLIESEHSMVLAVAVINRSWFENLPSDLQKIVAEDGRKVSEEIFPWAVKDVNDGLETWNKNGGEVIRFDAEEQKRLVELLQPLGAQVTAKRPDEKVLFDLLQNASERNR